MEFFAIAAEHAVAPYPGWGRVRFGGPEVAPEQRLAELESLLADVHLDAGKLAPFLAPMVGIPRPARAYARSFAGGDSSRSVGRHGPVGDCRARNQPLVLVFEDLQWFDPTSLDLVQALSDRCAQAPILLLATARPEFRPPGSAAAPSRHFSVAARGGAGSAHDRGTRVSPHPVNGRNAARKRTRGRRAAIIEEVTQLVLERGERRGARPFRRPYANRWRRGSIGWGLRAKSPRSARAGAKLLLALLRDVAAHSGPPTQGLAKPRSNSPWRVSWTQAFSSSKACPRRRATVSSMR